MAKNPLGYQFPEKLISKEFQITENPRIVLWDIVDPVHQDAAKLWTSLVWIMQNDGSWLTTKLLLRNQS